MVSDMSSGQGALVSVGYEGRTSEALLAVLAEHEVNVMVDVRLTPLSRKPGLSKRRLAEACAGNGIAYLHLPALGNPRENRSTFWSGDVVAGCERFAELMDTPEAVAALDQIEALAREHRTAVLCFERDHDRCHRQVVVGMVEDRLGSSSETIHA
jgi:uncharacterized protein (DUF488 family)